LALRDPAIATHSRRSIQDPGTASQELAKWQEICARRDPETAKLENGKKKQKRRSN
jgi:hypothetical protein